MTITISHRVPRDDIALGLVRVEGIETAPAPPDLAAELDRWVSRRRDEPLDEVAETVRKASRDILRNPKYKPTGRGKPASEYLLRAAGEEFPRINGPVDANNLISLKYCLAVSLWDLDLAGADRFEFRLGAPGERYDFNAAGQSLGLEALVCGCGVADDASTPMVTPIKDSQASKLRAESTRVAGCIYYPLAAGGERELREVAEEFLGWLSQLGPNASGVAAVCLPGKEVTF